MTRLPGDRQPWLAVKDNRWYGGGLSEAIWKVTGQQVMRHMAAVYNSQLAVD